jgi:hypothetical protein
LKKGQDVFGGHGDASQRLCHLMIRPSASSISASRGLLKVE